MKSIIVKTYLILLILISGCLKDSPVLQANIEKNNSADILIYLESHGDFINSSEMPSLITSDTVYNNLSDFIIVDIRQTSDFTAGHIQNAVNILHTNLYDFVSSQVPTKTIVIVSTNGQAGSYYTGLLRLAGFTNVFALKYGMASWNIDFANSWINEEQDKTNFNNIVNNKPSISALPEINFSNSEGNIKEKINNRIKELMNISFDDIFSSNISVTVNDLNTIYSSINGDYLNTYIVCYGQNQGEYFLGQNGQLNNPGHLPTAVYYQANNFGASDLRSTTFLQTIPSNKEIVVYSKIAHSSAFITAYLRLLGHNAKSLLFGMRWRFGFDISEVKNYPYVTGS